MKVLLRLFVGVIFGLVIFALASGNPVTPSSFVNTSATGSPNTSLPGNVVNAKRKGKGIQVFKADWANVSQPFVVCLWLLAASIAKTGFHLSKRLATYIPESCMLILLGIPVGFLLRLTEGGTTIHLTSDLFFYYLLPPIILDAGYFMPSVEYFYLNIGTILLYAVLGTFFNAVAIGASLYGVSGLCNVTQLTLLQAMVFGALISAVDPVAVLAVFEEVHVNEVLYILVFGESVLNDAASVVLYRTFESLSVTAVSGKQIGLAIASFFVVSIGGTLIGTVFAFLTSFITKYTKHVTVIEPIFVFLLSYVGYLTAEIFHFSGIMSILFCGIIMRPYVESNVSRKSHTTIKYFLKMLSSSCEAVIFMLLGVALVADIHKWNAGFIAFTLLFITIYRTIGVVVLTAIANQSRLEKVKRVEQFIMSYGGLRGAVAFCLAALLNRNQFPEQSTILGTTIVVVIFTVFVQGTTIKPLVNFLGVKKAEHREKSMAETLNDRVLGYMMSGMDGIMARYSHGFFRDLLSLANKKYLRYWFTRNPDLAYDEDILAAERKLDYRKALELAENPQVLIEKDRAQEEWCQVQRNPSYAMSLALKAQASNPDMTYLDTNILRVRDDEASLRSCAFERDAIMNTLKVALPKPRSSSDLKKKTSVMGQCKYSISTLGEEDESADKPVRKRSRKSSNRASHGSSSLRHRHSDRHHPKMQQVRHRLHLPMFHHRSSKIKETNQVPAVHLEMEQLPKIAEEDDRCNAASTNSEPQHSAESSEDEGITFSFYDRGHENKPLLTVGDTACSRSPAHDFSAAPIYAAASSHASFPVLGDDKVDSLDKDHSPWQPASDADVDLGGVCSPWHSQSSEAPQKDLGAFRHIGMPSLGGDPGMDGSVFDEDPVQERTSRIDETRCERVTFPNLESGIKSSSSVDRIDMV